MSDAPQLPPAGWYPTDNDPSTETYWDGAQWTNAVRAVQGQHQDFKLTPPKKNSTASCLGMGCLLLVLLVILLAVVGSCTKSTTSSSRTAVAPAAPAPAVTTGDARFISEIGTAWLGNSDAEMIVLGHNVCDVFAEGNTGTVAAATMLSHGATNDQIVRLIYASVVAYCPQYQALSLQ